MNTLSFTFRHCKESTIRVTCDGDEYSITPDGDNISVRIPCVKLPNNFTLNCTDGNSRLVSVHFNYFDISEFLLEQLGGMEETKILELPTPYFLYVGTIMKRMDNINFRYHPLFD